MATETTYFLHGLETLLNRDNSLPNTFARVKEISERGYYVNVEMLFSTDGSQIRENIPVLHNKYISHNIAEGDIVILLTLDYLQGDFQESEQIQSEISVPSYFALPYCFLSDFQTHAQNLADAGIVINDGTDANEIAVNSNGITLQTQSSDITINAGAGAVAISNEIGSLFECLNDLLSFLQSAQTGICSNGSSTTTFLEPSQLVTIQQKLSQILK